MKNVWKLRSQTITYFFFFFYKNTKMKTILIWRRYLNELHTLWLHMKNWFSKKTCWFECDIRNVFVCVCVCDCEKKNRFRLSSFQFWNLFHEMLFIYSHAGCDASSFGCCCIFFFSLFNFRSFDFERHKLKHTKWYGLK